jgi:tetratricopeptide (TPR) repeat protein
MRKPILFLLFLFAFTSVSYATDWKSLHERADKTTLDQALQRAAASPGNPDDQYVLGLVYLNMHKDREAYGLFSSFLEAYPDKPGFKWGLAESSRRLHETARAQELLNETLEEDPRFYPAMISLAYIKYFQSDFQGSVRLALKVIEQGQDKVDLSNYVRAYAMYAGSKGMLAHYGGLFSKAVDGLAVKKNLDKAQRLQPDSPAVLFGLGSYYLLAPVIAGGDKGKAGEYLEQALKVDPLFADIYVRLAQLAKIKGNKEKYGFYMNKALEIDPGNELAADTISGRCKFICTGGEE